MVFLEVTDRDGGTIYYDVYDSKEELLEDWPEAMEEDGEWTVWMGSKG